MAAPAPGRPSSFPGGRPEGGTAVDRRDLVPLRTRLAEALYRWLTPGGWRDERSYARCDPEFTRRFRDDAAAKGLDSSVAHYDYILARHAARARWSHRLRWLRRRAS